MSGRGVRAQFITGLFAAWRAELGCGGSFGKYSARLDASVGVIYVVLYRDPCT